MHVTHTVDAQARTRELSRELARTVDAHVSARRVPVAMRKAPKHQLREVRRHRAEQRAAGPQQARDLADSADVVGQMLQRLGADHGVERAIPERQPRSIADDEIDALPSRSARARCRSSSAS